MLIGGLPAVRAGDLGFALTCVGIMPAFEVATGSSKVFVGGQRAARRLDLARGCTPSIGGRVQGIARLMATLGQVAAAAGVVADASDAAAAPDPAMAAASALAAGIGAAAAVADAAAMAISAMMGTDPAVPPLPGALMPIPAPVLIGGFPFPNLPNPLVTQLERLRQRAMRLRNRRVHLDDATSGPGACPGRGGR